MKLTKTILRELIKETLNEELQEANALKNVMGRLRGGAKSGKHGYGWEAAVEQEKYATDCKPGDNYGQERGDDGKPKPCPGKKAAKGRKWAAGAHPSAGNVLGANLPRVVNDITQTLAKMNVQLTDREVNALKKLLSRATARSAKSAK